LGSILRVPLSPLAEGRVVLPEATGRYVSRVHRLSTGGAFVAFDPEARTEADAVIAAVGREVSCDVGPVRAARAVAKTAVTLLQAMGKGDKPEQIVRDATALGVTRLVFVYSARSVPRARAERDGKDDGGSHKAKRYRAVAVEAARQSGRGDIPVLDGPLSFDDALNGARDGLRLCLSPASGKTFVAALSAWQSGEPLTVLIGPEGGLDDAELVRARDSGFTLAAFGDFVLRTETAAVAVLGAIAAFGAGHR
jgi:16S rRNA (uracil1498-N3)-methyltransferase